MPNKAAIYPELTLIYSLLLQKLNLQEHFFLPVVDE